MSRTITLTRSGTNIPVKTGSSLLSVVASGAQLMPNEIFVYKRIYTDTNNFTDVFVAIASPADLANFNTVAPAQGSIFWRACSISLMCNSLEYANQVYNDIVSEVNQLVLDLNALDVLAAQNVDVIT